MEKSSKFLFAMLALVCVFALGFGIFALNNKNDTILDISNDKTVIVNTLDTLVKKNNELETLNMVYVRNLTDATNTIMMLQNELENNKALLEELKESNELSESQVTELNAQIDELNVLLSNKDATISDLNSVIEGNNQTIANLNSTIDELVAQLNSENNLFNQLMTGRITKVTAEDLEGLTEIRPYTFYNCKYLTSVELPSTIKIIGTRAFYGTSISSINLPSGIITISDGAFASTDLTSVTIPSSVGSIRSSTFESCYSLKSVTLNNGISSITSGAFRDCYALETINIPSSITQIISDAFNGCSELSFTGSSDSNLKYYVIDGSLYNNSNNGAARYLVRISADVTEFVVPEGITHISAHVASKLQNLEKVVITEGVKNIAEQAFSECFGLKEVEIPSTVTYLYRSFDMCEELISVTIKATEVPPVAYGQVSFGFNPELKIYVPAESVETYKANEAFAMYVDQIFAIDEIIEELDVA